MKVYYNKNCIHYCDLSSMFVCSPLSILYRHGFLDSSLGADEIFKKLLKTILHEQ